MDIDRYIPKGLIVKEFHKVDITKPVLIKKKFIKRSFNPIPLKIFIKLTNGLVISPFFPRKTIKTSKGTK